MKKDSGGKEEKIRKIEITKNEKDYLSGLLESQIVKIMIPFPRSKNDLPDGVKREYLLVESIKKKVEQE
ncbi:hypothetical protein JW710_03795 [Candidatus Dojkabacteria bacterium]|nr:hypothetical protein [Candidatus Dojkabacteria bacterium]